MTMCRSSISRWELAFRTVLNSSLRARPRPSGWPALASVLSDATSDAIWLQLYSRDRDAEEWAIVHLTTRRVERVAFPAIAHDASWHLLAVDSTNVIVEWHDENDLPHVGRFKVTERSPRGQ